MFNIKKYFKFYRQTHKKKLQLQAKKRLYSQHKHCKCGKLIRNDSKMCKKCRCIELKTYNKNRRGKRRKFNYTIKLLKFWYWGKQMSTTQIAKKLGCTCQSVHAAMILYNIKRRTQSQAKVGKLNPMFHKFGKLSPLFIPNLQRKYSWKFFYIREQIRKRDNYKCQKCGIEQSKCYRKLDVHHKDHNKKNIKLNNLISLCQSCHRGITNKYFAKLRKKLNKRRLK